MQRILILIILSLSLTATGCKFTQKAYNTTKTAIDNANIFTVDDDIKLGKQVKMEIESDSKKFPILKESSNRELYNYIRSLKNIILKYGNLKYKDKFAWEIKIIDDNNTLNAFATPGGYIYVYTGLIKFLDSEDELLGVLGHEMAHADRRHSTRQLTKSVGISILLNAALGDKQSVEQILGAIINLQFSRSNEAEADEYSVRFLCPSPYNAAGAAGFFKKMLNQPTPPEFLSTHPSPKNRVKNIEDLKVKLDCHGTRTNMDKYKKIKNLIR
ncbi:MAG TPA: peptidase M48 [Bacteroidetes bacterium]|nr:peptidase M48 [Bacteroidota bacterium]